MLDTPGMNYPGGYLIDNKVDASTCPDVCKAAVNCAAVVVKDGRCYFHQTTKKPFQSDLEATLYTKDFNSCPSMYVLCDNGMQQLPLIPDCRRNN